MSVTFSARANYKLLILNNGEQGEKCNNVRMRFVASLNYQVKSQKILPLIVFKSVAEFQQLSSANV